MGHTILVVALVAFMIMTVVALVRGIVAFLQESSAQVRNGEGPTAMQLKSNKMMQMRILYQAMAVLMVVILLFAAGKNH